MSSWVQKYVSCLKGKKVWKRIRSEWGKEEDILTVLIPEDDKILNCEIMAQLKSYMEEKNFENAVVIAPIGTEKYLNIDFDSGIRAIFLDYNEILFLMEYYRLHWFYDSFVLASLSIPYGNTVGNMLNSKKMKLGELVKSSIFC